MQEKHAGGRPPVDPQAVTAWRKYRNKARPFKPLALHLEISEPAVSKWKQVPEAQLPSVAAYLGVQPADLRPDLYPPWATL